MALPPSQKEAGNTRPPGSSWNAKCKHSCWRQRPLFSDLPHALENSTEGVCVSELLAAKWALDFTESMSLEKSSRTRSRSPLQPGSVQRGVCSVCIEGELWHGAKKETRVGKVSGREWGPCAWPTSGTQAVLFCLSS